MNRLWGEGKLGPWLTCILEPGNIYKLTNHQPIEIRLNEGPWEKGIPLDATLVITYSETPLADAKQLEKLVPPGKVEDRRTAVTETKRPHCPECKSTIEQLGVWRSDQAPLWLAFCSVCGCVLGTNEPIEALKNERRKS